MIRHAKANLLQIILALKSPGRLPGRLNGWKQQGNQNADDGDDDKQLNEREAGSPTPPPGTSLRIRQVLAHAISLPTYSLEDKKK